MANINNNLVKILINKILTDGKIDAESIEDIYLGFLFENKKRLTKEVHEVALFHLMKQFELSLQEENYKIKKIRKAAYSFKPILFEYSDTHDKVMLVELYLELNKIKPQFDEFLNKHPEFQEKDIIQKIDILDQALKKLNPNINEEEIALSQQLQEQINIQDELLESADKEIEELKKEIKKLKKCECDPKIKKQVVSLEEEKQHLLKKIKQQQEQIDKLSKESEHNAEELESLKRKEIEKTTAELSQKEKKSKIQDEIIKMLLRSDVSFETLKSKFNISDIELMTILKDITLNIKCTKYLNGIPYYGINTTLETNQKINLESNKLDCLFISDISLNDNSDSMIETLKIIQDYCSKNTIHYIFNLGNIFSIAPFEKPSIDILKKIEKITNEIITLYPKNNSINNFLLGGVNESYCSILGYNPMKEISNQRTDIVNIGYNHATININNELNLLHIYSKIKDANTRESICDFIKAHKSNKPNFQFNFVSTNGNTFVDIGTKTVAIPPLQSNNCGCNIYHIQATINEYQNIETLNILPIINGPKLTPTARIYYHK